MSQLDIRLAKALTAGIKRTLRESRVPVTHLDAMITLITDKGETLNLRLGGVPPFTTAEVVLNGEYVGGFVGHPDTPTGEVR